MGYWTQDEDGHSFADSASGVEMIWGDQPADIVDDAIDRIVQVFKEDVGRMPTAAEIVAGFRFSTAVLEERLAQDYSDEPEDAKA